MKRNFLLFIITVLFSSNSYSQGLLNKLKNKANQEVNKLEKGKTPQETAPNKNKLSANVTRTVLVKLHDDEEFDYGENCIDLGSSLDQANFILHKTTGTSTQCYNYKNGTRTPITCPTREGCKRPPFLNAVFLNSGYRMKKK